MKEFLQRLQKSCSPEDRTTYDHDSIVFKTDKPLDIVQWDIKMDQGVSLAIYRLPNDVGEQVTNLDKAPSS